MDKKKILIVGRTFFPELTPRSFRTTELAKELARQGHHVDVLLPQNIQDKIESEFDNSVGINFMYYGPLKWKRFGLSKNGRIDDLKRKFGRVLFLLFEYPGIEILADLMIFGLCKFAKEPLVGILPRGVFPIKYFT